MRMMFQITFSQQTLLILCWAQRDSDVNHHKNVSQFALDHSEGFEATLSGNICSSIKP